MKSSVSLLICLALAVAAGPAFAGADGYSSLPSAKSLPNRWEHYIQIEHKGGFEGSTSSICVSGPDLLNAFPAKDGSGLFWDYVRQFQQGRLAEQHDLGTIQGTRITETVIRFKEPIDYIKILAFTPPDSDLMCPFATIADMDSVLEYSRSEIVEIQGVETIKTAMVDNIAYGSPRSIAFYFQLKNGFPESVSLQE